MTLYREAAMVKISGSCSYSRDQCEQIWLAQVPFGKVEKRRRPCYA